MQSGGTRQGKLPTAGFFSARAVDVLAQRQ
jgi:hypothetical protein